MKRLVSQKKVIGKEENINNKYVFMNVNIVVQSDSSLLSARFLSHLAGRASLLAAPFFLTRILPRACNCHLESNSGLPWPKANNVDHFLMFGLSPVCHNFHYCYSKYFMVALIHDTLLFIFHIRFIVRVLLLRRIVHWQ